MFKKKKKAPEVSLLTVPEIKDFTKNLPTADDIIKASDAPFVGTMNPMRIGEGSKVDSGLFDPSARAAVPTEVDQIFAAAFAEVEEAMDLVELGRKLPIYGVLKHDGQDYIKIPGGSEGQLERLPVYINHLEKSLIEVYRKLADKQKELDALKNPEQKVVS